MKMNHRIRNLLILIFVVEVTAYPQLFLPEMRPDFQNGITRRDFPQPENNFQFVDETEATSPQKFILNEYQSRAMAQNKGNDQYKAPTGGLFVIAPVVDTNHYSNNYDTNLQNALKQKQLSKNLKFKRNQDDDLSGSDPDAFKRNAFQAFKRQKPHQKFTPSISVGAMTNLGSFFDNLKNNLEVLETGKLTEHEEELLKGVQPISNLRKEYENSRPSGTAAFLHAIRTYRPSQRVRALVSLNPDGYHGTNYLDPNYMWLGLGK